MDTFVDDDPGALDVSFKGPQDVVTAADGAVHLWPKSSGAPQQIAQHKSAVIGLEIFGDLVLSKSNTEVLVTNA